MQVAILAGGLGTRLRPLTEKIPKCMAKVGDRPFLYYLLCLLRDRGAEEVVLCTGYLGEQIRAYFGSGRSLGLPLRYSQESGALLGTGGSLRQALPMLRESFLVVNGDTYLDIDYETPYKDLQHSGLQALIVAGPGHHDAHLDLEVDHRLFVIRYDKTGRGGLNYVNAGVIGLKREVVVSIPIGQAVSLEAEVLPRLIAQNQVKACITSNVFYDIGSLAGLEIFEKVIEGKLQ